MEYAYNEVNNIKAVQRDGAQGDGFEYDNSRQITGFKRNATVNLTTGTVANPANYMITAFDGTGNRITVSNSDPALTGYTYTTNELNQYTRMMEGAVPTPTPAPPGAPTPTPPPAGQSPTPAPTATPPPQGQQVLTPIFSPGGGDYSPETSLTISIQTDTLGAEIWYTTNGTDPAVGVGTHINGQGQGASQSIRPTSSP